MSLVMHVEHHYKFTIDYTAPEGPPPPIRSLSAPAPETPASPAPDALITAPDNTPDITPEQTDSGAETAQPGQRNVFVDATRRIASTIARCFSPLRARGRRSA